MTEKWKLCTDIIRNFTITNGNRSIGRFIRLEEKQCQYVVDLLNEQEETIQELYDFRLIYNALLFNEWSKHDTIEVYKSKKHSDGELCFDGEWFVVVAILPTGQITNHYHIKYWDYFQIKEYPQVKDEFDGHTPIDVLNRLKSMVMCE